MSQIPEKGSVAAALADEEARNYTAARLAFEAATRSVAEREYNTLLYSSREDREGLLSERAYIGPTGLKVRVNLARKLQPANWEVDPPVFRSALEDLAGVTMLGVGADASDSGNAGAPAPASSTVAPSETPQPEASPAPPVKRQHTGGKGLSIGAVIKSDRKPSLSVDSSSASANAANPLSSTTKAASAIPAPFGGSTSRDASPNLSLLSVGRTPRFAAGFAPLNPSSSSTSKDEAGTYPSPASSVGGVKRGRTTAAGAVKTPNAAAAASNTGIVAAALAEEEAAASSRGREAALPSAAGGSTKRQRVGSSTATRGVASPSVASITGSGGKAGKGGKKEDTANKAGRRDRVASRVDDDDDDDDDAVEDPYGDGESVVVVEGEGGSSTSNRDGQPQASSSSSSSAAADAGGAGSGPVDPSVEAALLEEVLSASLTMDLQAAPVGGDSWLTSILIDFVSLQLARKFPDAAHFLPSNFMAYELSNALRQVAKHGDESRAFPPFFSARDLLNREVVIASDAIPPVICPFSDTSLQVAPRAGPLAFQPSVYAGTQPPPPSAASSSSLLFGSDGFSGLPTSSSLSLSAAGTPVFGASAAPSGAALPGSLAASGGGSGAGGGVPLFSLGGSASHSSSSSGTLTLSGATSGGSGPSSASAVPANSTDPKSGPLIWTLPPPNSLLPPTMYHHSAASAAVAAAAGAMSSSSSSSSLSSLSSGGGAAANGGYSSSLAGAGGQSSVASARARSSSISIVQAAALAGSSSARGGTGAASASSKSGGVTPAVPLSSAPAGSGNSAKSALASVTSSSASTAAAAASQQGKPSSLSAAQSSTQAAAASSRSALVGGNLGAGAASLAPGATGDSSHLSAFTPSQRQVFPAVLLQTLKPEQLQETLNGINKTIACAMQGLVALLGVMAGHYRNSGNNGNNNNNAGSGTASAAPATPNPAAPMTQQEYVNAMGRHQLAYANATFMYYTLLHGGPMHLASCPGRLEQLKAESQKAAVQWVTKTIQNYFQTANSAANKQQTSGATSGSPTASGILGQQSTLASTTASAPSLALTKAPPGPPGLAIPDLSTGSRGMSSDGAHVNRGPTPFSPTTTTALMLATNKGQGGAVGARGLMQGFKQGAESLAAARAHSPSASSIGSMSSTSSAGGNQRATRKGGKGARGGKAKKGSISDSSATGAAPAPPPPPPLAYKDFSLPASLLSQVGPSSSSSGSTVSSGWTSYPSSKASSASSSNEPSPPQLGAAAPTPLKIVAPASSTDAHGSKSGGSSARPGTGKAIGTASPSGPLRGGVSTRRGTVFKQAAAAWSLQQQIVPKGVELPYMTRVPPNEALRKLIQTQIQFSKGAQVDGAGGNVDAASAQGVDEDGWERMAPPPYISLIAPPFPVPRKLVPSLPPLSYFSTNKPLLFFWNQGANHWNLVRVQTGARKVIEVFEPMGKLTTRIKSVHKTEGLSLRSVPLPLIQWLDIVCPLPTAEGWKARTVAAITTQQQENGFDCGVACLLYAEKCLQGWAKEDVMATTDQASISRYRSLLAAFFAKQRKGGGGAGDNGAAGGALPLAKPKKRRL